MLKKFVEMMRGVLFRDKFDPSGLGDPVAMQTGWTPAKSGGIKTYFVTHKLAGPNPDRLEFQASTSLKLSYILFLGFGMAGLIVFFCMILFGWYPVDWDTIPPIGACLVLTLMGVYMFYFGSTPIVFDRRCGFFWKGRKNPDHVFDSGTLKHFAELEKIHALQLISRQSLLRFFCYHYFELNLVLEDGKRINVVDHGNQIRLREDAGTLSAFLDKPVWDAT